MDLGRIQNRLKKGKKEDFEPEVPQVASAMGAIWLIAAIYYIQIKPDDLLATGFVTFALISCLYLFFKLFKYF